MERGGEGRGRKAGGAGGGQLARAERRENHPCILLFHPTEGPGPPPPTRDMPINPLPRWGKQSPDRCDSVCPSPLSLPPSPPHTTGHLSAWELIGPDLPPQEIQKAPLPPTFSLQPHSSLLMYTPPGTVLGETQGSCEPHFPTYTLHSRNSPPRDQYLHLA